MSKNATSIAVLITAVVVVAAFLLLACTVGAFFVAKRILSPTVDTTGGTSLVYAIDAAGLTEQQKKGLSEKMIRVLRRRIDPDNIQNLVWLPQGDTRFEIQMPLPGARVRQKWLNYEKAREGLSSENIEFDEIIWPLAKPAKEQAKDFEKLSEGSAKKLRVLKNFAAAFDEYLPYMGIYDPSKNRYFPEAIQQMLKGTGVLEFRILPTLDDGEMTPEKMAGYVELLRTKGPKDASDDGYVWCEIRNFDEWMTPNSITAPFGNRHYVLASNKASETMLHQPNERVWRLERAYPTTDNMGRRAVGFVLDEKGGTLFGNVTGSNIDRPLCILLDGIAMSAPMINTRVGRQGIITGRFTQMEVEDIVNRLNAGALPAQLIEEPISVRTIGEPTDANESDKDAKSERDLSEETL